MSVLRVKAKTLQRQLPAIDSILFVDCERKAKTPVRLARCVVRLMDERDRRSRDVNEANEEETLEPRSQSELYARLVRLLSAFSPPAGSTTGTSIEAGYRPENPKSRPPAESSNVTASSFPHDQKQKTSGRLAKYGPHHNLSPVLPSVHGPPSSPAAPIRIRRLKQETKVDRETNSKRKKRGVNSAVGNLERIQRYSRLLDECSKQMGVMTEENTRFIRSLGVPLRFDRRPPVQAGVLRRVSRMVDDYQKQRNDPLEKISILSPRLLSLLPDRNARRPRLLSPSLFSFQADEPLSLPQLLTPALGRRETGEWMETLLEMSGAARLLEQTARRLAPLMHELETRIHPQLRQLDERDRAFVEVGRMHSADQRRRLERNGYAFMNAEQMQLIYENPLAPRLKDDAILPLSDDEREGRLESDIRRLAALDEAAVERLQRRARRQTPDLSEPIIQAPEVNAQEYPIWEVLSPFGFGSRINEGIVLEALILSPHVFFAEIMQPESMNLALLSPRAFIPSVLSPDAMIARILSPAAFRAEILSPRSMVAWLLSPEALILEVLSPKAIESLIIQILSPNALAPKIYSPEFAGVLVLSPSIASPRFMSGEKLMVEVSGRRLANRFSFFPVLSPQILGGSTESKSAEGGSKEETGEKSAEAKGSKEHHKSSMETKDTHEHSGRSNRNEADVHSADSKRVQPPHY